MGQWAICCNYLARILTPCPAYLCSLKYLGLYSYPFKFHSWAIFWPVLGQICYPIELPPRRPTSARAASTYMGSTANGPDSRTRTGSRRTPAAPSTATWASSAGSGLADLWCSGTPGSVQQSCLSSQFAFQCCNLPQLGKMNHFISICISIFNF